MATKEQEVLSEILPDLNTKYAYVLAQKNNPRGKVYDENNNPIHESEYKPSLNVLLKSSILWPYAIDKDGKQTNKGAIDPFSGKERNPGIHQIRYYDGCTTLFIDDQPKDKETIDALLLNTRSVNFSYGYTFVFGYDTMLKNYMDWCSYNEDSPYRVPRVEIIFKNVNTEKQMDVEADILDMEDEANKLAINAPFKKMKVHAKFLHLQMEDSISGLPLSEKAIRTEYRKYAKKYPKEFIKTYKDESLEVKTWVREAVNSGKINTNIIPNSAVWSKDNTLICVIGGIKDNGLIIDKLSDFAQSDNGADFLQNLKSLYS